MALKPYLQLVRLPNLFTAAADSLAGWLLATGSLAEPARWVPLVLASVVTYMGGIVLNDVFDHKIDLIERPGRPLPSGQVSLRFASWLGGIALAMGPILASASGSIASVVVALVLVGCVLGYDAGLKRTLAGPEIMGACRGLNLLLGLSQATDLGGPWGWLVAGSLAVFVVGVTWISRSEVDSGQRRGLVTGLALQDSAMLGLLWACLHAYRFSRPNLVMSWNDRGIAGVVVLALVAAVVNLAGYHAFRRPVPGTFQKAVKTGILSLVWLDVAAVAAVRGPGQALCVAVLWVPAFLIARRLYAT